MKDIRRKKYCSAVWIPLRAATYPIKIGKFGHRGFKEEFFGAGSIAIPLKHKKTALTLGGMDIGIRHQQSGVYEDGKYIPADIYNHFHSDLTGIHLVLDQHFNRDETPVWHLHQDVVLTLGLKHEGDKWVCPNEGYIEVVRITKDKNNKPTLLEIKADHLKDYLCAREMGLYLTTFHSRRIVADDSSFLNWDENSLTVENDNERWEGHIIPIHEGGEPYGEKMAVMQVSRTDVDESADIPSLAAPPNDENTSMKSWEENFKGDKLYRIWGELWKNEWLDPGEFSTRIKEDEQQPTIFFITDEQGRKESRTTLGESGKWLWFKPDVIMTLFHRRGGELAWHTRDTGSVRCSPDYDVNFGINKLGYVNVFAEDISWLPDWQQQLWVGFNVVPEGGVSEELLAAQVRATPADTQAPERFIRQGIEVLNALSIKNLNFQLFREHEAIPNLFNRLHRFRAIDKSGLYALAKDIARITADSIDASAIQRIVQPPRGTTWASLKSLENLLALKVGNSKARMLLGPFVGAYELRHADAHLPSSDLDQALSLLNIDKNLPFVFQGYQLLDSCVSNIYIIAEIFRNWNEGSNKQ